MKNTLFPRVDMAQPSKELLDAYSKIIRKKNPYMMVPYTVVFGLLGMLVVYVAISALWLRMMFMVPTLLLLASNILIVNKDRFFWLGPILFIAALENFVMLAGALILFYPSQDVLLCCMAYYVFLLVTFAGVLFCYRKAYRNFEEIIMKRVASVAQTTKPYSLFSSVVTASVAMFIAKNIAAVIIAALAMGIINYYLCPILAEQIVVVRQFDQLPEEKD